MSVSAGCNCHSAIVKGAGLVDPGGGGGGGGGGMFSSLGIVHRVGFC